MSEPWSALVDMHVPPGWSQKEHGAAGLALIEATCERIMNAGPFEVPRDVTAAIEDALVALARDQTVRTGDHVRAIKVHPATLAAMRVEMPIAAWTGDPRGFVGPCGMIDIIEDDSVEPGTFVPVEGGER